MDAQRMSHSFRQHCQASLSRTLISFSLFLFIFFVSLITNPIPLSCLPVGSQQFAKIGLRTLCCAVRVIPEQEFLEWWQKLKAVSAEREHTQTHTHARHADMQTCARTRTRTHTICQTNWRGHATHQHTHARIHAHTHTDSLACAL